MAKILNSHSCRLSPCAVLYFYRYGQAIFLTLIYNELKYIFRLCDFGTTLAHVRSKPAYYANLVAKFYKLSVVFENL